MKFEDTPLITPDFLAATPADAFSLPPTWVCTWAFAADNADDDLRDLIPVVVVAGRKHRKALTMTALQFALLCEVTRLGHRVETNSNFGKPVPKIYAKLAYRDAVDDKTTLGRIFAEAGPNEAVEALEIASDLRIPNLAKNGAGRPSKEAVHVMFRHVERLAREREAGGTLPAGFSVASYLENVRTLWTCIRLEAGLEG